MRQGLLLHLLFGGFIWRMACLWKKTTRPHHETVTCMLRWSGRSCSH